MNERLRVTLNTIVLVLAIFIVLFASFYFLINRIFPVWRIGTVQILRSPEGAHIAELRRADGIDLNFYVKVNGKLVYRSPDFAPNSRVDFHERLVWDKSGKVVVLKVTGRRLFGYDAYNKRPLSDKELLEVEFAPEPNDWEYGFEGTWPKEHAQRTQHAR